ncbi:MAG TPA: acetylxylan esterase [Prolixibacteraceae bacterium]|nr:acetylxylan esterase [Prolixibacteraceae bacterium]
MKPIVFFLFIYLLLHIEAFAQRENVIYDESKVPEYQIPDVLTRFNRGKVKSEKTWFKKQRPDILKVFTEEVYGKFPGNQEISEVKVWETSANAVNGLAIRKQLSLFFKKNNHNLEVNILMYLPKTDRKVPVFLACNFTGNHAVYNDPNIRLTESWVANNPSVGIINNQVTEQSRASASDRWPVDEIIKSGYGLVTVYYGDIDPDKNDFSDGIHPFFYEANQIKPKIDEWGSVAAWAWGLSGVMDYLEKDPLVDAKEVAVLGHSRLGKAALWAGATDQRFAMVISNESGCGGAALSKRIFGETVLMINTSFPHWFCDNFLKYNNKEELLPVDQHMLLALIAPRPLYVASAEGDPWADPKGEFLSAKYASSVYELLGLEGLPAKEMPEVNHPVMGTVGYHIRSGKHDLTLYDWQQYIRFADKHFRGK